MTMQELIEILEQVKQGRKIPGLVAKKVYTFKGFSEHTGKGRYPHLRGTKVIVIQSNERRIPNKALFLEPLLLLVNSDPSELRFGKLPPEYIDRYHSGDTRGIPNLYDCEGHYKALARYIKSITKR
jgi:hypothetical protein